MTSTESVKELTDSMKFNDGVLNVTLTDMTDELARRQLRDGGPSIAWGIGHLLYHRNKIAAAMSVAGPAFDLDRYETGATDGREYPTLRELRTAWTQLSASLIAALERSTPGQLAAPSPIALPHGEQTLLDALRFTVWHETFHVGQVSLLRSHHGLIPTATLVTQAAAAH
jgi:uncharacterized damage-inducible protein DinB